MEKHSYQYRIKHHYPPRVRNTIGIAEILFLSLFCFACYLLSSGSPMDELREIGQLITMISNHSTPY